jgi:hypothetical protein
MQGPCQQHAALAVKVFDMETSAETSAFLLVTVSRILTCCYGRPAGLGHDEAAGGRARATARPALAR